MGQEFYENISTSFRLCPPSHRPLRHLTNASAARFRVQPSPTDRPSLTDDSFLFASLESVTCIIIARSVSQADGRAREERKEGRKADVRPFSFTAS